MPFGQNSSVSEAVSAEAEHPPAPEARKFRFPLPFDPIRLVAGVLSRWPWIVLGLLVFGTLGVIAGVKLTRPAYAVSVSLIKRRAPQTVRTSETGQAFRPVDLNDATLLATLLAQEPLDSAMKRANNGVDPADARTLIEAHQLEGTDIFFITYHSPVGPRDALEFSGIWAEEINAYTQRLQQAEAHEVRTILQKEVQEMEKQIEQATQNLLDFSKDKNFLGGESQVSAVLGKLSQVEMELETARSSVSAKESQLANLTEQIRHQSPLDLQLKTAKEELANLRATYTDTNPLVQAKLQSIEYLESQIASLTDKNKADLDSYTGTPLGNQLYLSIMSLRNELLEARGRVQSLDKLRIATADRLREFPGIISGYSALQKKRDAHIEALSLMSNRLKEAEIFASGAPGYWQIFQAPDPRSILPSSRVKKPLIFGAAGGVVGAALTVIMSLLLTHRTSRRSIIECCAATNAPLVARIPTSFDQDAKDAVDHFWITELAPRLSRPGQWLFWTAALDPADERRLWTLLATAIQNDTGRPARIQDLTPDALWLETPAPAELEWWSFSSTSVESGSAALSSGRKWPVLPVPLLDIPLPVPFSKVTSLPALPFEEVSGPTIFRASTLPNGEARALLPQVDHWLAVVAGQKISLARAARLRPLTDAYLPACDGTVAWIERPKGLIRQAADMLSTFLAKRFS